MRCAPILARLSATFAMVVLLAVHVEAQGPGRGRGRGGFGRGMGNDLSYLVALAEVREELALDEEQGQLLDALAADLRDQRRIAFRSGFDGPPDGPDEILSQVDGRSRLRQLSEAGEKLIFAVLEPKQAERLAELRVQFEGLRAFDREQFVAALELTQLQRDQIREIRDERRSASELEAEVKMSLTEEQNAKWEQMKGTEFTFPERRGRFGRRGFGGPPRDDSND